MSEMIAFFMGDYFIYVFQMITRILRIRSEFMTRNRSSHLEKSKIVSPAPMVLEPLLLYNGPLSRVLKQNSSNIVQNLYAVSGT